MKKIISLTIAILLSFTCFMFTGCGQKPVYSESYTINDTHHWRNLVSGEGDDFIEYEEHVNDKGKCKCGKYYECPELIYRLNRQGTGLICYGANSDNPYDEHADLVNGMEDFNLSNSWRHIEVPATKVYEGVEYPVVRIEERAFALEEIHSIKLNEGLQEIGNQSFSKTSRLKEVIIPNSVTSMAGSVFYENTSIERVVFGNGTTELGNYMFYCASNLKEVVLSNKITVLGHTAFNNCTSLEYIVLPATLQTIRLHIYGVDTIDPEWNYSPFKRCSSDIKFFLEHDQIPEGFGPYADWNTCAGTVYLAGQWEYGPDGKPRAL